MAFCLCGCGKEVKNKWAQGHHARVNNPSSRPDVKIKRRESSLRRIQNGERTFAGWNKGLTKESDVRIKLSGEKASKTIMSSPEKRNPKIQKDNGNLEIFDLCLDMITLSGKEELLKFNKEFVHQTNFIRIGDI